MKWIRMDANTVAAVADTVYQNLLKNVAEGVSKTLGDAVMAQVDASNPGVKLHEGLVDADPWKVNDKQAHKLVAESMKLAEARKVERDQARTQKRIADLQAKLDALNAAAEG